VDVQTGLLQERARILDTIDTSRLDRRILEACVAQQGLEFAYLKRTRDTTHPQLHRSTQLRRHLAVDDNVANRESAAGLEHAERLLQHLSLVRRQVNHTVRQNDIHTCVGERDGFDVTLQELDI